MSLHCIISSISMVEKYTKYKIEIIFYICDRCNNRAYKACNNIGKKFTDT